MYAKPGIMRKINTILLTVLVLFTMAGCTKDSNDPEESGTITYVKTNPGGCNGQDFSSMKSMFDENDTLIFTQRGDTLDAFVGINYICCAPFTTGAIISNDSLFMTITDTCPPPFSACYCRCMCYYTWDFLFFGIEEKKYYYSVVLIDPQQEGSEIFREGVLDLRGE